LLGSQDIIIYTYRVINLHFATESCFNLVTLQRQHVKGWNEMKCVIVEYYTPCNYMVLSLITLNLTSMSTVDTFFK